MKLYNRVCKMECVKKILENQEYCLVQTDVRNRQNVEERGLRIAEELSPEKIIQISYHQKGVSSEKKIVDYFSVDYGSQTIKYESLHKNDMYKFVQDLNNNFKYLIIDFTLMNIRFMGAFLAVLPMFQWDGIFFGYTEPGEYYRDEREKFDLKNSPLGYEEIPGLESLGDITGQCDWIVFFGFEGSRLMRMVDEAPITKNTIIPFISIPAMQVGWHNFALDSNMDFFELHKANSESIEYVSATNPFEVYRRLEKIQKENMGIRLVISPLSTKPVILGTLMHTLENCNNMILFDNPYQEETNTYACGTSFFYDLTYFIDKVQNTRFRRENNGKL